jgi:hypothetical protein
MDEMQKLTAQIAGSVLAGSGRNLANAGGHVDVAVKLARAIIEASAPAPAEQHEHPPPRRRAAG